MNYVRKSDEKSSAKSFANFFGGLGYLSNGVQWVWLGLLILPSLLQNQRFMEFVTPQTNSQSTPDPPPVTSAPSEIIVAIGVIVTVIVIVMTIVVLSKLPKKYSETSSLVVTHTAERFVPIVTHHRKTSLKKRRKITAELVVIFKSIGIITPLIGTLFALGYVTELPIAVAVFIAYVLACGSTLWFGAQYIIAHMANVPRERLL